MKRGNVISTLGLVQSQGFLTPTQSAAKINVIDLRALGYLTDICCLIEGLNQPVNGVLSATEFILTNMGNINSILTMAIKWENRYCLHSTFVYPGAYVRPDDSPS